MTDPARSPDGEHLERSDAAPGPDDGPGAADAGGHDRPDVDDMAPDDLEALATDTLDRLEAVTAERDDYLDRLRRLQADFENYKKRTDREHQLSAERATGRLAEELLPVLDACDAALQHGADGVGPIFAALLGALEKQGLERVDPLDAPFDPAVHEAVMHEHGDGADGPIVVEVLRPGYVWKGQVLRAAMVKVKG